ncbi:MAG TPA: hypothetical protein VFG00_12145, partial [Acidothermaceae bacterium]|nr:hypothetical protein [Acidothermaceae bacterium]
MVRALVVTLFAGCLLLTPSTGSAATSPLRLAQMPYVGVSCPEANVTTCGRVGVAVWLSRRGASEVVVSVAGVRARLGPPPRNTSSPSWRTFVHLPLARMGIPAVWDGEPYKVLTLRVLVRYGRHWLG